ncbi:MAG TPA: ribosome biogenesis GTPase Der [Thermomicrobiales bacterium]|nr:ribosome biogenesis GTPase Der [Thermomicrobiales bacterium]
MKPIVAIIGRPNAGKSTLFNRLIGEQRAIVEDVPGTTRDRLYGDTEWAGYHFTLIDTGGLQEEDEYDRLAPAEISERTQNQARLAIEEADLIVFVVDGTSSPTAADHDIADILRASHKPVVVGVNKAESRERQEAAVEYYELGLGEPIPFSALHGIGTGDLLEAIVEKIPKYEDEPEEIARPAIAIVGRPNVGKSELVNRLLGSDRTIVSDVAGTTRDSIDTRLEWAGLTMTLIDTAGIRRRGSIEQGIERYSVMRSMRAIDRADVAVVVIDATEPFTAQDAHVAGYVVERGKGIVVAVNKWDAIEKDSNTIYEFQREAATHLPFIPYAPMLFISAKTGQRVEQVLETSLHVAAERRKRISTGELNRMLRDAVAAHPPPTRPNNWVKFYYATQVDIEPPRFVFFCNNPKNVHFSYKRYLENEIRSRWQFTGTPIILHFRSRRRGD